MWVDFAMSMVGFTWGSFSVAYLCNALWVLHNFDSIGFWLKSLVGGVGRD